MEPVVLCLEMYVGVKELESKRVDGRVILGMRIYEGQICVDSPPSHHISPTHLDTHVHLYIYIYI